MFVDLENANLLDTEVNYDLWYQNWDLLTQLGQEYAEKRTTKKWAAVVPVVHRQLFKELRIGHMLARYIPFPQAPSCDVNPVAEETATGGPIYFGRDYSTSLPVKKRETGAWVAGIRPGKD